MSKEIIHESDMNLCYNKDEVFLCEKYTQSLKIDSIKTVEIIKLHCKKIFLIEAKSSAPNPESKTEENSKDETNKNDNKDNNRKTRFKEYIDEIAQKAMDSFTIFASIIIDIREGEIGEKLRNIDYSNIQFSLVLIIKNHEKEWCSQVKNELETSNLSKFSKVWNWGPQPILVLNEEMARKIGLIAHPDQTEE